MGHKHLYELAINKHVNSHLLRDSQLARDYPILPCCSHLEIEVPSHFLAMGSHQSLISPNNRVTE